MTLTDADLRRAAVAASVGVLTEEEIAADLRIVQRRLSAGDEAPIEAIVQTGEERTRSGRRTVALAAAAVVLVVITVATFGRDRRPGTIVSPGVATTLQPAVPTSRAPAPSTNAVVPTTIAAVAAAPTSDTTTGALGRPQPIVVDAIDPPPLVQPTAFVTLPRSTNPDGQSIEVAAGNGRIAVRQPGSDLLALIDTTDRGGAAPTVTTVTLDEPLTNLVLGPADVVYGIGNPRASAGGGMPDAYRMVAIALSGGQAGHVVAESDLDPVASSELPAGAFGHGLLDIVDRTHVNAPVMRYADPDGNVLGLGPAPPPLLTWTPDTSGAGGVVADTSTGTRWDLAITTAPTHQDEYLPPGPPAPTTGGRMIFSRTIGADLDPTADFGPNAMPVVAILEPDGTGRWIRLPDDWTVAASDLWGTVLMRTTATAVELVMLDDVLAAAQPGVEATLTRPVLAVNSCRNSSARDEVGSMIDGAFARRTSQPAVTQVFGNPDDPYGSPFVIVQRFFSEQRASDQTNQPAPGLLTINPNTGRSSADWILADGSEAYINTRNIADDDVAAIARSLVARPSGAAIPGFDVPASPLRLDLIDDAYGSFDASVAASSSCTLDSGRRLTVAIYNGRPLASFVRLLDSPSPLPAARTLPDGRMLVVSSPGGDIDLAAALDTVRQATPNEWQQLRNS